MTRLLDPAERLLRGSWVHTDGEIEQAIIANNPAFRNVINSISPSHSYYNQAVAWGEQWFRANGY